MTDPLVIGVDLGGTKVQLALVASDGTVSESLRLPTGPERGADAVIASIAGGARELVASANAPVLGIGVGVAGQVDRDAGMVCFAPNLKWHDVPLRDGLSAQTGLPVSVLNDVQAATFGEWVYGAGRGVKDMVCLFVGTGVGGGAIVSGQLAAGAGGSAGEFGHTIIAIGGRRCRCGSYGCVEAYAGGWAIGERAVSVAASGDQRAASLLAIAGGEPEEITARTVAEAAHAGDALAREIVEEVGRALGACAVNVVNGLNPKVLLLGGGIIEGIPLLIEAVSDAVRRYALPSAAKAVRVMPTTLHEEAGTAGAAAWMRFCARPGSVGG